MAASLVLVPEVAIEQELMDAENSRADYKVNGRPANYFQYVDWDGHERIIGAQRTPVRIKYRSAHAVHNRLQMVINPVSRTFVMLNTNEDGTELDGYEETTIAIIDGLGGVPQTIEFIDLNFTLPPPETLFSAGSMMNCIKFLLLLLIIVIAVFAVGYIGYFIFITASDTRSE